MPLQPISYFYNFAGKMAPGVIKVEWGILFLSNWHQRVNWYIGEKFALVLGGRSSNTYKRRESWSGRRLISSVLVPEISVFDVFAVSNLKRASSLDKRCRKLTLKKKRGEFVISSKSWGIGDVSKEAKKTISPVDDTKSKVNNWRIFLEVFKHGVD